MTKKIWLIESEIKQKYSIKCLHWTYLSIQPHFLPSLPWVFCSLQITFSALKSSCCFMLVSQLSVSSAWSSLDTPTSFLSLSFGLLFLQCLSWPHSSSPQVEMTSLSFVTWYQMPWKSLFHILISAFVCLLQLCEGKGKFSPCCSILVEGRRNPGQKLFFFNLYLIGR